MIESEIYLLANNLQLYNKLQELNVLNEVTEIMQNFIEGEKESYEIGVDKLMAMNEKLEMRIKAKDQHIKDLKRIINAKLERLPK